MFLMSKVHLQKKECIAKYYFCFYEMKLIRFFFKNSFVSLIFGHKFRSNCIQKTEHVYSFLCLDLKTVFSNDTFEYNRPKS